jgi:hypothetical protein
MCMPDSVQIVCQMFPQMTHVRWFAVLLRESFYALWLPRTKFVVDREDRYTCLLGATTAWDGMEGLVICQTLTAGDEIVSLRSSVLHYISVEEDPVLVWRGVNGLRIQRPPRGTLRLLVPLESLRWWHWNIGNRVTWLVNNGWVRDSDTFRILCWHQWKSDAIHNVCILIAFYKKNRTLKCNGSHACFIFTTFQITFPVRRPVLKSNCVIIS